MSKSDETVWVKVDEGAWIDVLFEMCKHEGNRDEKVIASFLKQGGDSNE